MKMGEHWPKNGKKVTNLPNVRLKSSLVTLFWARVDGSAFKIERARFLSLLKTGNMALSLESTF